MNMSKERELLNRIIGITYDPMQANCAGSRLSDYKDILKEFAELEKHEPFNPDWVSYRQGKEDGKAEEIDRGIRIIAYRNAYDSLNLDNFEVNENSNATLILDEGVEL
jgi:hypothetical protein